MGPNVAIIGGGIAGLAAAHELTKDGAANVTLLEASDRLGGLGAFFRHGDQWVDRFYHCVMPTDSDLLGLIQEVGLADQVYWKPTRMSFIVKGSRYAFNTPADLLRFQPLSIAGRLRLGVVSLMLRRLLKGKDLDNLSTRSALSRLYGQEIWKTVWKPLFQAKFGPHAGNLPALYLWERLGRERNVSTRGYLKCGLKGLIDALEGSITRRGGRIRLGTPVAGIRESGDGRRLELSLDGGEAIQADWVISTAPLPLLAQMTRGSTLENSYSDPQLPCQGVINALFFLSRPLDGFYWAPVVKSGTGFDGVVEMSALVDPSQYGGQYLAYVMKYCDRNSRLFSQADQQILEDWTGQFLNLYRDLPLGREHILGARLFRAPFVEPIYPLGYLAQKPSLQAGGSRLILATTAQVYPSITAWNSSTRLARQAVQRLRALSSSPNRPTVACRTDQAASLQRQQRALTA